MSSSVAALIPLFTESVFPEFALQTTVRRVRTVARDVDAARADLHGDVRRELAGDLDEVEGLPQRGEPAVGASVVDHHDLVPWVAQGQERRDRRDDPGLLVVHRHDHRIPGVKRDDTVSSRRPKSMRRM